MNRTTPMLEEDDVRETPSSLFQPLNAEFGFTLDVCATHANAKCERYCTAPDDPFWTSPNWDVKPRPTAKEIIKDGLTSSWAGERVWCNPPFSDIGAWIEKAHISGAALVVMLVPSTRTEQEWWQELIEPYRDNGQGLKVRFLPGRQHFLEDGKPIYRKNKDGSLCLTKKGKPQRSSPKFGCCLLIWG